MPEAAPVTPGAEPSGRVGGARSRLRVPAAEEWA
jgi:hypothetical protein